ncbi:neutral zinc metallopeptidase [Pseudothioclava nitratireducens]|uniref:KPN_02809 family neutral zinc metallopeptidase n=1 Tax=Pseudothioclava nitratireducens TaxID=1928646 RepID=UPI0023DA74AC|nr:neutral zinc metallopeptidase [Defluviimonas nitratireducens]MDF1621565.1 neutral zinc metallopeptidase [Defluviimonas nitratireducens]
MKWQGRRGSRNIEDRRGQRSIGRVGGVTGVGAIAVLLLGYFLGVDVTPLLSGGGAPTVQTSGELSAQDRAMGDFVSVTLADTEEVWTDIFAEQLGREYDPVTLVLFSQVTQSACGNASGATGPFYCPGDKKVYLDTDFFTTLTRQLGAGGDFAAAYVVAHEVAHHVQDELGILGKVNALRARASTADSNALSVRVELQADCFSGVWARHAAENFGTIERGDIAEAMNAAAKIGDDTLQRNAGRRPMPDSFTHGSSEQRQRWFAAGFESGEVAACDTFSGNSL